MKVNVSVCPTFTAPPEKVTVSPALPNVNPAGVVPAAKFVNCPAGNGSFTMTSYAFDVPLFVTASVTVNVSPASALCVLNAFVIASFGSTTVTSTFGVVTAGSPSTGTVSVAVLCSTVWPGGIVPTLLASSRTRAVTRMRKELFPALLSPVVVMAPKAKLTAAPSPAPPVIVGAGSAPPKSALSRPPLAAAVVTMLLLTYCIPTGRLSTAVRFGVAPSGSVIFSAYVTVSPMVTFEPAVLASLVAKRDFAIVATGTVTGALPLAA